MPSKGLSHTEGGRRRRIHPGLQSLLIFLCALAGGALVSLWTGWSTKNFLVGLITAAGIAGVIFFIRWPER